MVIHGDMEQGEYTNTESRMRNKGVNFEHGLKRNGKSAPVHGKQVAPDSMDDLHSRLRERLLRAADKGLTCCLTEARARRLIAVLGFFNLRNVQAFASSFPRNG
jgi:hypothetical protein